MKRTAERRGTVSGAGLQCTGGQYRIYDEIGAGGMATVHLARFLGTGGFARTVAVKRPLPALQANPEFRRLVLREARLAARVHHPHVVSTLDVVEASGELLIAMDYVAGEPLSALMERMRQRGQRVPLPVVTTLIGGALRGLAAVHGARDERGQLLGLIHRDVSPQNILVGLDGLARLADFGLARATSAAALSNPAEFKGKLTYASPEQVELHALTPATDIYSMAVILWELITGQRLYRQLTTPELVARLLTSVVVRPSEIVPELPAELDVLVMRALSRDPTARHESALEMAVELESVVAGASLERVASWLQELASESLDRRMRLVVSAEMDTASSHGTHPRQSLAHPAWRRAIADARDRSARAASMLRAASWRVMALGVGVSVAWGGGQWLGRGSRPPPASVAARPVVSDDVHLGWRRSVSSPPLPDEPAAAEPAASSGRGVAPAEAADSAHRAPAPRVARPAVARLARRPREMLADRAAGPAPMNCSPPFSLDARGIRHMRSGCE